MHQCPAFPNDKLALAEGGLLVVAGSSQPTIKTRSEGSCALAYTNMQVNVHFNAGEDILVHIRTQQCVCVSVNTSQCMGEAAQVLESYITPMKDAPHTLSSHH